MTQISPTGADPFARAAVYYDLDLAGYTEDIELYRDLLRSLAEEGVAIGAEHAVLELGCGTARVASALAADGVPVVGLDISRAMLAHAARHAEASGGMLSLVEGDMRTARLDRRFALVLVPLGGLEHMETPADVLAALQTVRLHLAPGGLAVVDVMAPDADDFTPGPRPTVEHWTRDLLDGTRVTKSVAAESDPASGLRHVTFHYDAQPPDGALHRTTEHCALRVFTPAALEFAAVASGLQVSALWGDYHGRPLEESDGRMIALLEHAPAHEGGVSA